MVDIQSPLATKIRKQIVQGLSDFKMIQEGDQIMVCCSGGKDSTILLLLLQEISRRSPIAFTVEGVMLDQKQPGFDDADFRSFIQDQGLKLTVIQRDTYSIVKEKITDGTYCSLCSRLRRAILYDHASEHGFTKLALGHHRDDAKQTLLMNLFYTGKLASKPAKLRSDDGRNILLRPMIYVAEKELLELHQEWKFPVIPCNLCGSQTGMKRQMVKSLIKDLEKRIPEIQSSMIKAQSNTKASQLLDQNIWDFSKFAPEKSDHMF